MMHEGHANGGAGRLRVPVLGLLGLVAFAAVGLAALRSASPMWASVLYSAALASLATAVVMAIARRGRGRVAWVGYAAFAATYLLGAFHPREPGPSVAPPVVVEVLLDPLLDRIQGGRPFYTTDLGPKGETFSGFRGPMGRGGLPTMTPQNTVSLVSYRQIGHSLAAILSGLVGATLGYVSAHGGRADRDPDGDCPRDRLG